MLSFPNCKINIGLHIISKRDDGFHDLETVFYPIYKLHDALEILPQAENTVGDNINDTDVQVTITGLPIDGDGTNNLCLKAYHLLKNDFPQLPALCMHLHKAIPMGAGLGGGSADGAFALSLLNNKFHLNISEAQLLQYALQLGSDCPFFITNKPCLATGRGEKMEPLPLDLNGYSIVLINPGIHINTGWAFSQITPRQPATSLASLIYTPIEKWKGFVTNYFEAAVTKAHPIIDTIKQKLYNSGAVYASMSGSGSTVYGIFKSPNLPLAKLYPQFLEFHLAL